MFYNSLFSIPIVVIMLLSNSEEIPAVRFLKDPTLPHNFFFASSSLNLGLTSQITSFPKWHDSHFLVLYFASGVLG
jgi:hypothetical protein